MLAFNDKHVFGFSRLPHLHRWVRELDWHVYRASKTVEKEKEHQADKKGKKGRRTIDRTAVKYEWSSRDPDLYVNSMVLTKDALFIAGPPAIRNSKTMESLQKWQGKKGGMLWCLSAEDGKKLAEIQLVSPPVYEGMAVAYGKLFVALKNGSIVCLE